MMPPPSLFMFAETYAQYNPMYFTYTDMMKSLFVKQMDVTNMQRFWDVSVHAGCAKQVSPCTVLC